MSVSISMADMLKAGAHYGHLKSRWHPKMKEYIYGTKNNIHVLDLNKSVLKFADALTFMKDSAAQGKRIMFVGAKPQAATLIESAAKKCGVTYMTNRWLGGTLTNFSTIKTRIRKLKDLEIKFKTGGFDLLTKKEKLEMEKKIEKMNEAFGGMKEMTELPQVLFITDLQKDHIAVKEAKCLGIKLVGIADSNVDPNQLDYPIPANDDSMSSLEYIYDKLAEVINFGKANPVKKVEKPAGEKSVKTPNTGDEKRKENAKKVEEIENAKEKKDTVAKDVKKSTAKKATPKKKEDK